MNARYAWVSGSGIFLLIAGSIVNGGNRPQPSAPSAPQQPQQTSQNTTQGKSSGKSQPQAPAPPPIVPPTTQPSSATQSGLYYPSGDGGMYGPNGYYYPPPAPQQNNNNPNANNNNAANGGPVNPPATAPADKPTPAPVIATPSTPPDPELAQATADLNNAMTHLRDELLKNDPAYASAAADKKSAQAEVTALRGKEDSAPEAILAAATRALDAGKRMAAIERAAITNDRLVLDAQSHVKALLATHNATAAAAAPGQ